MIERIKKYHPPLLVSQWRWTDDTLSFQTCPPDTAEVPRPPHPGAFGVRRQHHYHEGIDIYCLAGTPVYAIEDGEVVAIEAFTGEIAGSPWWENTWSVLVEGESGVMVYGEIEPATVLHQQVKAGDLLGYVVTVLKKDKGRPMAMLHFEWHQLGARESQIWSDEKPLTLLDPTCIAQGWVENERK